eukprot:351801-Chlamydomonas_euryale.AAC.16
MPACLLACQLAVGPEHAIRHWSSTACMREGREAVWQAERVTSTAALMISHEFAHVQDNGRPPLLFLHGSYHGAWCWQENFLPFFADVGYNAYALSFRGQGESVSLTEQHMIASHSAASDNAALGRHDTEVANQHARQTITVLANHTATLLAVKMLLPTILLDITLPHAPCCARTSAVLLMHCLRAGHC